MTRRVLHLLSQRPDSTGSGVTLDALVRAAGAAGWEQWVACGLAADDPHPEVGGLPPEQIWPLRFGADALPFALPGMSDVMPYPSSRFSALGAAELAAYERAWKVHLAGVIAAAEPAVIHCHHLWLLGSWVKDVAPRIPVVSHCHATGLRQMVLCPHFSAGVVERLRRNELFAVLHAADAAAVRARLEVPGERVRTVGAGYRPDLFHAVGRGETGPVVLYAGKTSRAKGLPQLLDAVARLAGEGVGLRLRVAGTGHDETAAALRARMQAMPNVELLGQLDQAALAAQMRQASVFVLPSFFEGLPLVLVEALASGCRPVCTALPGVVGELGAALAGVGEWVPMPRLRTIDEPEPASLPTFVADLAAALRRALERGPVSAPEQRVEPFTWARVFARVEALWREVGAG